MELNPEGSSVGVPRNYITQAFTLDILKHSMKLNRKCRYLLSRFCSSRLVGSKLREIEVAEKDTDDPVVVMRVVSVHYGAD
jgi:hypothetical protein